MTALAHLGHRLGLDEQETVRAVNLRLLPFNQAGRRRRLRGRSFFFFFLFVVVAGGNPVLQNGVEVRLYLVRIGLVFLLVSSRIGGTRPDLILILILILIGAGFSVLERLFCVAILQRCLLELATLDLVFRRVAGEPLVGHLVGQFIG